jgi:LmbE family N-acetylglucosaminyl deacetylase
MSVSNKKTILGITAHPDDHIVFAGTIFKLQDRGYEYSEVVLTDGGEGGLNDESSTYEGTKSVRSTELSNAQKFLDIKQLYELGYEDLNLQVTKKTIFEIVKIIREVKPDIILGMNKDDIHPDHINASILTAEAARWACKNFRYDLGKPHRCKQVFFAEGTKPISPQFLSDISPYIDKKVDLFKIYVSQAEAADIELLKSQSSIWGYHLRLKGATHAEAFTTESNILPIIFDD